MARSLSLSSFTGHTSSLCSTLRDFSSLLGFEGKDGTLDTRNEGEQWSIYSCFWIFPQCSPLSTYRFSRLEHRRSRTFLSHHQACNFCSSDSSGLLRFLTHKKFPGSYVRIDLPLCSQFLHMMDVNWASVRWRSVKKQSPTWTSNQVSFLIQNVFCNVQAAPADHKMGLLALPLGIFRTIMSILQKLLLHSTRPLRIDLPLPFVPIDIVFVSEPNQVKAINQSPNVHHLHSIPTKDMPKWCQLFFSATNFHNFKRDKWFLAFESDSDPTYVTRRAMHDNRARQGFTHEDVHRVAQLCQANADEETVADALAQIVAGKILGKEIPRNIVREARKTLKNPQIVDALIPGHYSAGAKGEDTMFRWCQANVPEGVEPIDGSHAIGSTSRPFAHAVMVLKDNLDTPVEYLFTRSKNCPTQNLPRFTSEVTTLNGLLDRPSIPAKTVIIFLILQAAEKSSSLFFTFGAGIPGNRICAMKDFIVNFLTALQQDLKSSRMTFWCNTGILIIIPWASFCSKGSWALNSY